MASFWDLVKEYVKAELPDYLPVPSIADVVKYQPLKFLILKNGASFSSKWYEKPLRLFRNTFPSFDPVGEIDNFAATPSLDDGSSISLPDVSENKLCICGEDTRSKTILEGQIANNQPNNAEGTIKTSTMFPCLGEVSRHSVNYRELRAWIERYWFLESCEDIISEAKTGNLFIIHDVIMAEKLYFKGKRKQSISGHICSSLKLNYESKTYSDLKRPSEFGPYPIAYKIAKITFRRTKHVAHASAMTRPAVANGSNPSSPTSPRSIYRLKIEPLRDFSQSSRKRLFGKENSPLSEESLSPPCSKGPKRTGEADGSSSS